MHITKVVINRDLIKEENSNMIAFGSFEIQSQFVVNHVRVVRPADGRVLICMPSLMTKMGKWQDVFEPKTTWMRQQINDAFFEELKKP